MKFRRPKNGSTYRAQRRNFQYMLVVELGFLARRDPYKRAGETRRQQKPFDASAQRRIFAASAKRQRRGQRRSGDA